MEINKKFDFLCVGTQKGGTTALYAHLLHHPEVLLSKKSKEFPYFCYKENIGRDFDFTKIFTESELRSNKKKIGKITPQYMSYVGAAKEIYNHNKNVKIIILLRDPVKRLVSHFKMCVKRGYTKKGINQFIDEYRIGKKVLEYPKYSDFKHIESEELNGVISWGSYGRILSHYLTFFDKSQILVLNSNDLNNKTQESINKICDFIGVSRHKIIGIEKKHHVGKDKMLLPDLKRIKSSFLGRMVRRIVPQVLRKKIFNPKFNWWYSNFFSYNSGNDYNLSEENLLFLEKLYAEDKYKYKEAYKIFC